MIKKIYIKHKEISNYLIFGELTTSISLLVYYILTNTILNPLNNIELQIANILSWILSVSSAYITNKLYVFETKEKNILKEIINFFSSRILTLILDILLMYIFVSILKFNDQIIKLLITIIVVILNYILSKIFVFKK